MKVKVLFVCHGNICRSPVAEFVFRDMVSDDERGARIECASCATSGEHIGDPVDPRSQAELMRHGIDCSGKRARRLRADDFDEYDYMVCMDRRNLAAAEAMRPSDSDCKVSLLLDHAGGGEVPDPWYTGDFPGVYRTIERGCRGLLDTIEREEGLR